MCSARFWQVFKLCMSRMNLCFGAADQGNNNYCCCILSGSLTHVAINCSQGFSQLMFNECAATLENDRVGCYFRKKNCLESSRFFNDGIFYFGPNIYLVFLYQNSGDVDNFRTVIHFTTI